MLTPRGPVWIGRLMVAAMIVAGAGGIGYMLAAPTQEPPEPMVIPYGSTEAAAYSAAPLDRVCREYVDSVGLLNYAALKENRADLDAYIDTVTRVSPHSHIAVFTTEGEALAYWINAYNAWMMRAVIEAYPVGSVNDIGEDPGVFDSETRVCGGEALSLNFIENEIVRKDFLEPRAHFALNCASMGCPWLPQEAFDPTRLEEQLERETRRFFAVPSHLDVDADGKVVYLSAILDWYGEDFIRWLEQVKGIEDPTILDYVKLYAPRELAEQIGEDFTVEFQEYGWGLNDVDAPWAAEREKYRPRGKDSIEE